ncbi:hypothetical protein [Streptomyces collinus]
MTRVADKKAVEVVVRAPEPVGITIPGAGQELTRVVAQLSGRHR